MRTLTKPILFLWLASWMLAVLQPCCEAVAETLPHEHGHPPGQTAHAEHASHEHDHGSVPDHRHCETELVTLIDLTVPPAGPEQRHFSESSFEQFIVLNNRLRLSPPTIEYDYFRYHPPPASPVRRVYLDTQRLRI